MESIKRKVRVTVEKEMIVELMPSVFGDMTGEEYLASFCQDFWTVDSMDDVVKYAARVAATGGLGYQHDGIGLVNYDLSQHPRTPDVKIREICEDIEAEIIW